MKLDMMRFKDEPVGFQLTAENDAERRLIWALRDLPVQVSETWGMEMPQALLVCPKLPWGNVGQDTQ